MQVKVFESTDMASGLKMVRQELGPDALILSTRTVKSGKLGLLGKQVLEITAAIDTAWPTNQTNKSKAHHPSSLVHKTYKQNSESNTEQTVSKKSAITSERDHTNDLQSENRAPTGPPIETKDDQNIRHEFDELKNMVKNLAGEISRINQPDARHLNTFQKSSAELLQEKLKISKSNNEIENILDVLGINNETAQTLSTFAKDRLNPEELQDKEIVLSFLNDTISDLINVQPLSFEKNDGQKRIALLGPTGVGKTTTLAKIAASYLSEHSDSIALITIDTYRIAAVEQLKVYGEIMHLPVDVVITPQQLVNAIEKHKDKELILIDTAGRSPRDTLCIDELQSFLVPELAIENHLVLSSTTRDNELVQTINQFEVLGISSTIYTKTDECSYLGVLLNMQVQTTLPISYITNGQRVPEDIITADKEYIAQLIIPTPRG